MGCRVRGGGPQAHAGPKRFQPSPARSLQPRTMTLQPTGLGPRGSTYPHTARMTQRQWSHHKGEAGQEGAGPEG